MTVYQTIKQIKNYAEQGYKMAPLYTTLFADIRTPIEIFRILKNISKHCFILESAEDTKNWGRYTFIGFDPMLEITCLNGILQIKQNTIKQIITPKPSIVLRKVLQQYKSPRIDDLPPFSGGLMGYFSFDYIRYIETSIHLSGNDEENFKDLDLMMFHKIIAFDHYLQKIFIIINISLQDVDLSYQKGYEELTELTDLIKYGKIPPEVPGKRTSDYNYLFDKSTYCKMVEHTKKYIYEGDVFQAVLSNRAQATYEGSLLNTYRVLRTTNPSPYMFYMASDDVEITGASPETLVKLKDRIISTFPLAGTRKRGKNEQEDLLLEQTLRQDEKECAEHNMLVDLGRNDIGKISEFGSVKVTKYMNIERFSHVMHLGSTVQGKLREDKDALDAIDATLPAGTLSGAPKLRACEIISKLENNKRGIYGGAIGYIDMTGNMDMCIAIRLVFKKNNKVFIRSGAGIVADSIPKNEYHECIQKAKAVMQALQAAEEIRI